MDTVGAHGSHGYQRWSGPQGALGGRAKSCLIVSRLFLSTWPTEKTSEPAPVGGLEDVRSWVCIPVKMVRGRRRRGEVTLVQT